MALILSLETATAMCSVALHDDGELVGVKEIHLDKSHSEYLVPMIEQLVEGAGHKLLQLGAIAVSMGPGSYTGLRIGTSCAKGLCYALETPLIAVNTLLAMAAGVSKFSSKPALLCPMLDARRMEVYCLVCDKNLKVVCSNEARIIQNGSFSDLLGKSEIWFFGNGSDKVRSVIPEGKAVYIPDIEPSAMQIGELAHHKYVAQDFEDLAYFEPLYLKEFRTTKPKPAL
jgi:tRNA threonylcarbamoyladenosine biosynthesis protein TsaB